MTSPIVLLPVVDRLKLTQDKDFTAGFSETSNPLAVREFVEKSLAGSLLVDRGTGGQLIYVSASSKTAAKAAEIANAVADVYLEQDRLRRNGPASERAQRYSEELAELRNKAQIAQDKVTAFRKEHDIDDLSREHGDNEEQALDTLHQRLLETQNERRSLESKASGLQSDANQPTLSGSPRTLRAQLESQLAQMEQLKKTYGPQHPTIVALETQIASTRQSLGDQERSLAGARELEKKFSAAVTTQEERVRKLRESRDEGSKLLLELDSAKSVYKQALDGFDQIMFQAGANHANVSIVSHAVAPLKASKPNKLKLLMMTLAAAMVIAFAIPLGYEMFLDRRVRCRDDLEREFGVPVLAQLEEVPALVQR
jgi:uncharacterized protein involved in exopolysaccharide biosynthesis